MHVDVSMEDLKKKLLCLPGPSCNHVYRSRSSTSRPSPDLMMQCFPELDRKKSLGNAKKVYKSIIFYKAIPLTLVDPEQYLEALSLSLDKYTLNLLKNDDLLSSSQRAKILAHHPVEQELRTFLIQEGVTILET